VRPPLEGIDLPGIFVLRTIPDSNEIRSWIECQDARSAVIVGAGFVGLEMAENLVHRGLGVTVIELADQVMPPLDPEMARPVEERLRERGVDLRLGDGVAGFELRGEGLLVRTAGGGAVETDLVILAIGVRPETHLAVEAGLELGETGGIRVDERMRTSDPAILAVGDAVEVRDVVTGAPSLLALAGPANRQGRLAADSIAGRDVAFRGVQATSVCGAFGLVIASTGATEKALARAGIRDYEAIHLHPGSHVGYFPGASPIHMKLLFSRKDGRVLGLQAIGEAGAERRVDVVAMAIQMGATVFDLEQAELCYAPQFGAAKDPVNLAGMVAANVLRGDLPLAHWRGGVPEGVLLVDVRDPHEYEAEHVPGALNLPLGELRGRLDELTELAGGREVWLYCVVGQRAYYATRALVQRGHRVRNLSGGIRTWHATGSPPRGSAQIDQEPHEGEPA
jgi:NADPH-dependent 2,4-dienoyl-CoA reductase/sulfur reductase-like enzyme/rhodanese-related sulfurtransferase